MKRFLVDVFWSLLLLLTTVFSSELLLAAVVTILLIMSGMFQRYETVPG